MYLGKETYAYNGLMSRDVLHYSNIYVNSISGVKEETSRVYPNPASNTLVFQSDLFFKSYTFELYNEIGAKVETHQLVGEAEIDIQHLKPGIYFYKSFDNENSVNGSFVKI